MENPWANINITQNITKPDIIIQNLFEPVNSLTNGKIKHKIEKVNFFPEEVTYSLPELMGDSVFLASMAGTLRSKKNPHPEFGYDPDKARQQIFIRYRSILFIDEPKTYYEYEIFKFKYSTIFYPMTFFLNKGDYNLVDQYFDDKNKTSITINSEKEVNTVCAAIIQSDNFTNLLTHMIAL